jgi:hypothetical protein
VGVNNRSCLLVIHPTRSEAMAAAKIFISELSKNGFEIFANIEVANTQLFKPFFLMNNV